MTILEEIYHHKRNELEQEKRLQPLAAVQRLAEAAPGALDFAGVLRQRAASGVPALIAEVKHRSPSRGLLIEPFDPLELAEQYAANGATAISVLTDQQYFGGSLEDLHRVASRKTGLPVLRKDFIFDAYQVYQARAAGADALLLIAAMLEDQVLKDLQALTNEIGMQALIEVHNQQELERVLPLQPGLVGINNRDLHTFEVSLETTRRLAAQVPAWTVLVAESGVHTAQDVRRLGEWGAQAVLVGEALVAADNLPAKVRELAHASLPQQERSP